MRIGVYDPYLDDIGGGEKYMMTLAKSLVQGNEVDIFWDNIGDLEKVAKRFDLDVSNVRLMPNIFSPNVGFIKRFIETKKYDVLIILSDGSVPIVSSKKLFLHVQQPLPGLKVGLKSKMKLSRVDKVFCNSYFTKRFVDKNLGVDSIVIYPPVTLHPKKEEKENIILHVGRFRVRNVGISDYKKQDVMVKEFKKMVDNGLRKWKFIIAASVDENNDNEIKIFEEFVNKAKDYPIEFEVNKTNKELWDLYSRAKIYWHASGFGEDLEKHPEFAEHFGISTVEAMGAGVVPVVINSGGQKEIVEDEVSGFLWNTLEELKERTLLLTKEDKILKTMSSAAKKRAQDFAGDRFGDDVKRMVYG
ncbi:MAG TPA: glycosyltransferase [Patescibacteria group bacterium]|nr:glycosyltransferase [Patescibacteria group bacterium]